MSQPYILYAWELSYFSGKLRAYLRFKQLPFRERAVDAWTLMRKIPQKTGATVMPVLVSSRGEWLQDTTAIIAELEARHPQHPALPGTPRQRILALLIEAWADEFWIPSGMHYRWSYPENYPLFEHDAGSHLLPLLPAALRRPLARRVANQMRSYLPTVGVIPEQLALIERWTEQQLDALNSHLSSHLYLLGDRPCVADFALIGPLYAHLGRDPWPLRELIQPRPHLAAWIRRVHDGEGADGQWLPNDAVPDTLHTLLHSLLNEFLPQLELTVPLVAQASERRGRLPRTLDSVSCRMADGTFRRPAMPYALWMLQRVQQEFRQLPGEQQDCVRALFAQAGRADALDQDLGPHLERAGLHARRAAPEQRDVA